MIQKKKLDEMEYDKTRIKNLLKKYKDGWKTHQSIIPLSQPVMILIRRNQRVEFHEAQKNNELHNAKFIYKHSGGETREIELNDSYLHTADYGKNTFKAYIHHEDWAFPMSPNPITEYKRYMQSINNAMSADLKWKAEERKASAKQLMAIAAIIAVIAGGIILYVMLKPQAPPQTIQIIQNVTRGIV